MTGMLEATNIRQLGVIHAANLYGWPVLLDFMFDGDNRITAIRPRVMPPIDHAAGGALAFRCSTWSMMLKFSGGAVALQARLRSPDAGERAVIAAAAQLEAKMLPIITEARQLLADRLAREALQAREGVA